MQRRTAFQMGMEEVQWAEAVWQEVCRTVVGAVLRLRSESSPLSLISTCCPFMLPCYLPHSRQNLDALLTRCPRLIPAGFINDHHSPHSHHHIQTGQFLRGNSDASFNFERTTPQPPPVIQRTASDIIKQPKPVPVCQLPGRGPVGGRGVAWKLGSED